MKEKYFFPLSVFIAATIEEGGGFQYFLLVISLSSTSSWWKRKKKKKRESLRFGFHIILSPYCTESRQMDGQLQPHRTAVSGDLYMMQCRALLFQSCCFALGTPSLVPSSQHHLPSPAGPCTLCHTAGNVNALCNLGITSPSFAFPQAGSAATLWGSKLNSRIRKGRFHAALQGMCVRKRTWSLVPSFGGSVPLQKWRGPASKTGTSNGTLPFTTRDSVLVPLYRLIECRIS
jgi:hypothetical protein